MCIPNTPILYIALIGLYYYLYIADKRIIILSVKIIYLYLAQIIGMLSRLWKLALKRLAKSSNCTKKGRCGR